MTNMGGRGAAAGGWGHGPGQRSTYGKASLSVTITGTTASHTKGRCWREHKETAKVTPLQDNLEDQSPVDLR